MSKICQSCAVEKPASEFYPDPAMRDRLKRKCKDCLKSYSNSLYKAKPAPHLDIPSPDAITCRSCKVAKPADQFHRDPRSKTGHKSQCRACKKAADHFNRGTVNPRANQRYKILKNDPLFRQKHNARAMLKRHVSAGKISPLPCHCGNPVSQAHHTDYSKPLDVIWLCQKHHSQVHRKF